MSQAPRRRWFQFGLRTMFVAMTLFAVWLGWELKFVSERRDLLALAKEEEKHEFEEGLRAYYPALSATDGIPFWRRWLGDEAVHHIDLPRDWSRSKLEKTRALFPEANISSEVGLIPRQSPAP